MDFLSKLGFTCNAQASNETAACMIVGEGIYVMLLTRKQIQSIHCKTNLRYNKSTEVLVC